MDIYSSMDTSSIENSIASNEWLFCLLSREDRQILLNINQHLNDLYNNNPDNFWSIIDKEVLELIKIIPFESIVKTVPIPDNYHRIRISEFCDQLSVVLFIFKVKENNGQAVLFHTYDHQMPNDKIYDDAAILDPKFSQQPIVRQTPPHTHRAKCHSCIAWTSGNIVIAEQYYESTENNCIRLSREENRILHHCNIDNTPGKMIHSIKIIFY